MPIGFICARLNELSHKVPVALVLMIIERSLKPEQPGLFCLIRLEVRYSTCVCRLVYFLFPCGYGMDIRERVRKVSLK